MIFQGEVPAANRQKSQRNYFYFSGMNGVSYMCLGENIISLLLIKLAFGDTIVAICDAMIFSSYFMLPLGRKVCSRIGAAQSQATFWTARNIASLLVACGGLVIYFYSRTLGAILLLIGVFWFYASRAAGVAISTPLIGSIAISEERGRVFGVSTGLFYLFGVFTLLAVSSILYFYENVFVLVGVIIFGSTVGITSASFIRNIDESAVLRDSSKKSLLPEIMLGIRDKLLWKYIFSIVALNCASTLVGSGSILMIKRGYHISDMNALFFTLTRSLACGAMAIFLSRFSENCGPRRTLLVSFVVLLSAIGLWLLGGDEFMLPLGVTVFWLCGTGSTGGNNSLRHYFLQQFDAEHQVAFNIIAETIAGTLSGVLAMAISAAMFWVASQLLDDGNPGFYRLYLSLVFVFIAPLYFILRSLPPLSAEKRQLGDKFWIVVNRIF